MKQCQQKVIHWDIMIVFAENDASHFIVLPKLNIMKLVNLKYQQNMVSIFFKSFA